MSNNNDHDHSTHDHNHDHNHTHEHEHDHADCCSMGEEYEHNLAEQRKGNISRRQVLQTMGASGLLIAGGAINAGTAFAADLKTQRNYSPLGGDEFDGLLYISGDHHIHTRYSPDAKYAVQRQVAEANYHGLGWMVITDHGGVSHNKLSVDLTYPDILRSRTAFPGMLVFTGLEMNIPGGEHGTVIVQPTALEKDQIKQFEAAYDGHIGPDTEAQAVAGLKFLDGLSPKPIFFANHPARRGLDSPHEIRNWKAAAPDVAYGFEGAPGHQAAGLIRDQNGNFVSYRGGYGNKPQADSFAGFPVESYFTYGGFDWMTAKLGGVWDSLLGDGLRWWITANSDSHKYFNDLQDVDGSQYDTVGYTTELDSYFQRPSYSDFRPGEYSRTYVITKDQSYAGVMAALRAGKVFVVTGDLIDRLKFTARTRTATVTMGDTLTVKRGEDVTVTIAYRIPSTPNWNNDRPVVDHTDLIAGNINYLSKTLGLDNQTNPSTKVVRTFNGHDHGSKERKEGIIVEVEHTFRKVESDFYIRLRGTNTNDRGATPKMDPDLRGLSGDPESPWDDLWFYSNPIFVHIV